MIRQSEKYSNESKTERSVVIRAYTPDIAIGLARGLSSRGARIVVSSENPLTQNISDITRSESNLSDTIWWVQAQSCGDPLEDAKSLRDSALQHLDSVDVFVFERYKKYKGKLLSINHSDWSQEIANINSAFFHAITFAQLMQRRGGSIIFVVGIDSTHAYSGRGTAAILDGGLLGMTRALAVELAPFNIRVNAIAFGITQESYSKLADETILERILIRCPIGRLGDMDEFCSALEFLMSDQARFMTGQLLKVDGGWSSLNQAPSGLRFP